MRGQDRCIFAAILQNPFRTYKVEIIEALKLAYPIILGQLGIILMGVSDTIMVGRLGSDALASVNQANNIFFMFSGISFGVLFSVSTMVSIKVGEGKAAESFITYRAGLLAALIMFVGQYAVMETITANFSLLGQKGRVNELAPAFLHIINLSVLPMLINIATRQYTDGLGHTKVAMITTLSGLLLNIFLAWIMIYGNLGCKAMGINGAAYATLISRCCMAMAGLWFVRYSQGFMKKYRPIKMPPFKEVKSELPQVWKLGLPIALQTFAEWACFSISGIMVGWWGASRLAAHAVALNVASLTYMVVSGIGIAGSIMVGNAYGEANKKKIKRVANAVFLLIAVFELLNALFFTFGSGLIAQVYGVTAEVRGFVIPLLLLAAVFQLADGIQAGAMNLLRGITDVNWASVISVLSYWVVSLPLSYYLGKVMEGDVFGIWLGFTIGLFVAAISGVFRFYLRHRSLNFEY